MRPKGIIYQKKVTGRRGEVYISLPKSHVFAYKFIRTLGAALVAFVFLIFLFGYGPIVNEEVKYALSDKSNTESSLNNLINTAEAQKPILVQEEAKNYGVSSYFSIVIPKIDAASNVIANVDTLNRLDYSSALKKGVAHARGTYFPGQGRTIYLFSHSTDSNINAVRFNAVFYLLRKLELGDKIIVYFADKKYEYTVTEKMVVPSTDIKWLHDQSNKERLVLQTCDPPGTTWKRLLVIAEPVY